MWHVMVEWRRNEGQNGSEKWIKIIFKAGCISCLNFMNVDGKYLLTN